MPINKSSGQRIRHKFTPEEKQSIIDNINKKPLFVIAQELGISEPALRSNISRWRNDGEDIPFIDYRPPVPVGTITERKQRGHMLKFIKTEDGWRRYNEAKQRAYTGKVKLPPNRMMKKQPVGTKKAVSRGISESKHHRKLKAAQEHVYDKKPLDLQNKVAVKIDSKTTVFVKPGTNIKKYLERVNEGRIQKAEW